MVRLRIRSAGAGTIRTAALAVATVASLVWMTSGPLHAAQLRVTDPYAKNEPTELFFRPRCHLTLKGAIFPGDADRIRREVEAFERRYANQDYRVLCLSSPGGDLGEALALSAVFYHWMMVVDEGAECVSACAMMFMRSKRRDHVFQFGHDRYLPPGRYLHHQGRLGFHASRLELPGPPDTMVSKRQATEAYARALATVRELIMAELLSKEQSQRARDPSVPVLPGLDAGRATEDMGFVSSGHTPFDELPLDLIVAFLVTPPNETYWITTVDEALHWGIEIVGIPPPARMTSSMLMMACMNVASARCAHGTLRSQCPQTFEAHLSRQYTATSADGPERLAEWTDEYKFSKQALWPRATQGRDRHLVQGFRVAKSKSYPTPTLPCAIRATWRDNRLFNLEIQTFNGNETSWLGPQMTIAATELDEMWERSGSWIAHLRPWKMLPLGTKLVDLGKPKPWGWLDDGPDFFDRPARW